MSVLFDLPGDIIGFILSEFVCIREVGSLDTATANSNHRNTLLQVVESRLSVRPLALNLSGINDFYNWVHRRKIIIRDLLVKECNLDPLGSLLFDVDTQFVEEIMCDICIHLTDYTYVRKLLQGCTALKKIQVKCFSFLPMLSSETFEGCDAVVVDICDDEENGWSSYGINENGRDLLEKITSCFPAVKSLDLRVPVPVDLVPLAEHLQNKPNLTNISMMSDYNGFSSFRSSCGTSVCIYEGGTSFNPIELNALLQLFPEISEFECATTNDDSLNIIDGWLRHSGAGLTKLKITGQFANQNTVELLLNAVPHVQDLTIGRVHNQALISVLEHGAHLRSLYIEFILPMALVMALLEVCIHLKNAHFHTFAGERDDVAAWIVDLSSRAQNIGNFLLTVSSVVEVKTFCFVHGVVEE